MLTVSQKIRQNTAGRAKGEGDSRIIRVACVSSASGSAISDAEHATFELFLFFRLQLGTAGCSRGRTGGARCSTCPG